MLRTRLITGSVLVGLLLTLLFGLPLYYQIGVLTLVIAGGGYEWAKLSGLSKLPALIFAVVVVVLCGLLQSFRAALMLPLLFTVLGLWLVQLQNIFYYPKKVVAPLFCMPGNLATGLLMLVATWGALSSILGTNQGVEWLLQLLLIVIATDTGAYLVGRQWGRAKLVPQLSPAKTWLGLIGGVSAGTLTALGAGYLLGTAQAIHFALLSGFVISFFAVLGDLTESLYKRLAGVKDSGNLLPGHGGVLDRIDSLMAAGPAFALYLFYLLNIPLP